MLSALNLSVSLDDRPILSEVSLQVAKGTWLGILGPNGAGKTTLIRAVSGLIPSTGEITLMDRPIERWSARERAREVALVAQSVPMYFDFSVRDLVLLGRSPHKRWLAPYTAEDETIAAHALDQVDMAGFEERSVLTLSGGEQRRVLLAQALAQDASLLLLDEPTSHLDVRHEYGFMETVRSLVDSGRTAVGVFHNLELAARFADQLLILDRGRVAAQGTPGQALTAERIRSVFAMEAGIEERQGRLRIDYTGPTA